MVSIVVAQARNRVIGDGGSLPWHLPGDLRRFRALTVGNTVVMGRKTFESLPAGVRPLPERRNVVLSRDPGYDPGAGAIAAADLATALRGAGERCFVIGGGEVYRAALPAADRLYVTDVDLEPDGDVLFPALAAHEWRCVEEDEPLSENGQRYVFRVYDRRA